MQTFNIKIKGCILVEKIAEWFGNSGEIFDESSVEPNMA